MSGEGGARWLAGLYIFIIIILRQIRRGRPKFDPAANTSKKAALWSKIRLKEQKKQRSHRKKQSDERVSILLCFFCVSSGFWLLASGSSGLSGLSCLLVFFLFFVLCLLLRSSCVLRLLRRPREFYPFISFKGLLRRLLVRRRPARLRRRPEMAV